MEKYQHVELASEFSQFNGKYEPTKQKVYKKKQKNMNNKRKKTQKYRFEINK